jgi:hypothetical protein
MSLPFTDTFPGADGPLGAGYTAVITDFGSVGIVSNSVVKTAGAAGGAYDNTNVYNDDQYVEAIWSADNYPGLIFRASGSGTSANLYVAIANAIVPKVDLFKVVAGSFIFIDSFAGVTATGSRGRIETVGTTHSLFIDGVLVSSIIDASIASGSAGVYAQDGGGIASWEGGNMVTAPPVVGAKIIFQHA